MGFFAEFKTDNRLDALNVTIGFFLGVILLGIFNIFPDQRDNATVFFIMLIVWGFTLLLTKSGKTGALNQDILGIGKNGKAFLVATIIGAVIGYFLTVQANVIINPIFMSVIPINALFGFLYVVIVAPVVEANFFRGLLMPTLAHFLMMAKIGINETLAGVIAVVISAAMFAWFHSAVFGGNPTNLLAAFVFGIIAGLGVYGFKSIGFEYGLHGVNNLLAFLRFGLI